MLNGMPGVTTKKVHPARTGVWVSLAILATLLLAGAGWLLIRSSEPRAAPEAERVLQAQTEMPFQVLIPAYLPKTFQRDKAQVITDQAGPHGEKMIRLLYPTRRGESLTLSEWLPGTPSSGKAVSDVARCVCICRANQQCTRVGMEFTMGSVRVRIEFSAPGLLAREEMQFMLETLGPATNRQIYSSLKDVPRSFSLPPAVDIPVGPGGVQEVTLVVSPEGYTPAHFAVKKDVPVRLIFRQLGQVGCGSELNFQWQKRNVTTLVLASEADKQVLEFTPEERGEFPFNCPHLIYRGVMTVK